MKRFISFLIGCSFFIVPAVSHAQETWTIENFASDLTIQSDGAVRIQEVVEVDFGSTEKHGIYRDVPYVYSSETGENIYTQISNIAVLQDGTEAEVDVTKNDYYMRIRIGDPDKTITGPHTYTITYVALGVLASYEGVDELYWDVTGNQWEVPIESASATVHVPVKILQASCYKGTHGSANSCDDSQVDEHTAIFTGRNLDYAEGLTVAVGFTPGSIPIVHVAAPPTVDDVIASPITGGITLSLIGAGILYFVRRWYKFGRDRYWQRSPLPGVRSDREGMLSEKVVPLWHRQSVSVEYESPDQLRPAEIGVVMDEKADTLDVSATIVDLASRGFVIITEIPKTWMFGKKDYELQRTNKVADGLMEYERVLLEKLFDSGTEVKMSELKDSFYTELKKVKELLYEEVVRKQLFPQHPDKVRSVYIGIGIGIMVVGGVLFASMVATVKQAQTLELYHQILAGLGLSFVVVGFIALLFGPFMSRKTGYGREIFERVKGYKLFVSGTEKYRAKFLEKEGLFEQVLPYAIVFGVTDQLAKAFKDMGIEPSNPTWFHGATAFNIADFTSTVGSFSESLSTAISSSPSSSGSGGGGFSGGGFGGGGGGSW